MLAHPGAAAMSFSSPFTLLPKSRNMSAGNPQVMDVSNIQDMWLERESPGHPCRSGASLLNPLEGLYSQGRKPGECPLSPQETELVLREETFFSVDFDLGPAILEIEDPDLGTRMELEEHGIGMVRGT